MTSMPKPALETLSFVEKWKVWQYKDHRLESWDAQPACFITDFVIAIQVFSYICTLMQIEASQAHPDRCWYIFYFLTLGIAALVGGILHLYAYELYMALQHSEFVAGYGTHMHSLNLFGVFPIHENRFILDSYVWIAWRIALTVLSLNAYSLVCWTAKRHYQPPRLGCILKCFALLHVIITTFAVFTMNLVILFIGSMPALFFGVYSAQAAFKRSTRSLTYHQSAQDIDPADITHIQEYLNIHDRKLLILELLVYGTFLTGCFCQAIGLSISDAYFNQNALSHVLTSIAAFFMLRHYNRSRELLDTKYF